MNQITDKIIQKAEEENFSGVISMFRGEEVILNRSFGDRDAANKLSNETDTKFGIASGTKLFTALGIGKLVEQGKIKLDSKIKEIRQDPFTFIDGEATIGQLLSHTSGIFDYYDEEIISDFDNFFVDIPWYQLETPTDYLPLFLDEKAKFKPGQKFSYSNGGFVFLGILIEEISGMRYRDFIEEQVLLPAQMAHSGFFALNELPPNTANGYKSDRKASNIYNLPIRGGGDGGMFTTTFDLKIFWNRLFANKILSKELTESFLKTHWKFNEKEGYGYGLYKAVDNSMFSIVGGDAGVGFDSRYLPRENIVINILSNITDGEELLRTMILDHLDEIIQVCK